MRSKSGAATVMPWVGLYGLRASRAARMTRISGPARPFAPRCNLDWWNDLLLSTFDIPSSWEWEAPTHGNAVNDAMRRRGGTKNDKSGRLRTKTAQCGVPNVTQFFRRARREQFAANVRIALALSRNRTCGLCCTSACGYLLVWVSCGFARKWKRFRDAIQQRRARTWRWYRACIRGAHQADAQALLPALALGEGGAGLRASVCQGDQP